MNRLRPAPSLVLALAMGGAAVAEPQTMQSVPDEAFTEILSASPFTRNLDVARQLVITSISQIDGETFVTVLDKETKETQLVGSANATEQGLQVLEVTQGREGTLPSVKISVGSGQQAVLRFDETLSSPTLSARRGGQPNRDGRGSQNNNTSQRSRYVPAPKGIMDKYNSLSNEQKAKFQRWSAEYYRKNPQLKGSEKRFGVVDKAIEAARGRGEFPR